MIDRRAFLKTLCAVPVGIALTRWTEAVAQAVVELWDRGRLVAVRPIALGPTYQTIDYTLTDEEKSAIEHWDDLTLRIQTTEATVAVSSLEISAPMPAWYQRLDRAGQKAYARHARRHRA